jgi:hypothetical protein
VQRGVTAWCAILGSIIRSVGYYIVLTPAHQEENYEASDDAEAD